MTMPHSHMNIVDRSYDGTTCRLSLSQLVLSLLRWEEERREERGERRRQTLYLLFLAMLTVLTADCQAWTWDAWQHDTPLFEAVQLLFVFVGILERGGMGWWVVVVCWLKIHENPTLLGTLIITWQRASRTLSGMWSCNILLEIRTESKSLLSAQTPANNQSLHSLPWAALISPW